MSRWKEAFEGQNALQLIRDCLGLLKDGSPEGLQEKDWAELARLLKVLKVLEARFAGLDSEIFPLNTWGSVNGWLVNVNNQVKSFAKAPNGGNLANANNTLDEVLRVTHPAASGADYEAIREAAAEFQRMNVDGLMRVKGLAEDFKKQLLSLGREIAENQKRIGESNHVVEQQKARLDQAISEFQRQFSDSQEKRNLESASTAKKETGEFEELRKNIRQKFADEETLRKQEHEARLGEIQASGAKHLGLLSKREEEVNRIFGAIGSASLSGAFKQSADEDGKAADRMRWIALGLMAAMVLVGGVAFILSLKDPLADWRVFAFRLGTTLVIAVPAVYAAQESSKHRDRERKNRKLQLELASIDAYLALLPDSKQHELKEKLTEKFFGTTESIEQRGDVSRRDLFGLLQEAIKGLTSGK